VSVAATYKKARYEAGKYLTMRGGLVESAIELDSHLDELVRAHGYDGGLAESIADELLPIYMSWESKAGPNSLSAIIPGKKLVVRNADLRLFDAAVAAVLSAASVGFFVPSGDGSTPIISAITGILVVCLQTGRQLLRKGVILTPEQFELISLLRAAGRPLSLTSLSEATSNAQTEDAIRDILGQLQKVRLRDGSVVQLVSEDYEGLWGLEDV